ncbi:MAG: hypothetical protein V4475_03930 [Pseudomonadota bacterium]
MNRIITAGALLLGLFLLGNGLVMLADPVRWYFAVPGVTTTGPFNQHFLRDIGLIYMMMGGGFLAGIVRQCERVVIWAASTLWLAGHALFHFWEVSAGICGPSALVRDFPGVTTPAILGLALTVAAMRLPARAPLPRSA